MSDTLRTAVTEYVVHYHTERNHQGLGNELLTPLPASANDTGPIVANTDTKLLIYGLFQKGRVLAQDGAAAQRKKARSALTSSEWIDENTPEEPGEKPTTAGKSRSTGKAAKHAQHLRRHRRRRGFRE